MLTPMFYMSIPVPIPSFHHPPESLPLFRGDKGKYFFLPTKRFFQKNILFQKTIPGVGLIIIICLKITKSKIPKNQSVKTRTSP
jgi:hypothetical protein